MINIKRVLGSVAFTCATMGFAFAADALRDLNDVPAIVATDEWVVSTTPYFWVTFYEGDMTVNGSNPERRDFWRRLESSEGASHQRPSQL